MDGLIVADIVRIIEQLAPVELAMDYDNVGLIVGDLKSKVTGVMVGLELNEMIIKEAISFGCNVIVVHHPLIFRPVYSILAGTPQGNKIFTLVQNNISVIAAHTNLDSTVNGLNDFVLKKLGIEPVPCQNVNIRIGTIKTTDLMSFIKHVKDCLELEYIHYCGDEHKQVSRVGLCTGSGMSFYRAACDEKVDVFITGDMKYHDAVDGVECGVPIIDATHFGSEIWVEDLLHEYLSNTLTAEFPIIKFTQYKNPIKVFAE